MGAKHVLRPKSHQRSVSYALNTSKLGDETVAFKFYGRCKKGLLTSPGWSAPWSARGWWWLAWQTWWCAEGPRHRGQGHNQPTDQAVSRMSSRGRPHLESPDPMGASGSRLDTGRRPLQGSPVSEDLSRVRLRPVSVPFGNRYICGAERRGQTPDDHTTE